MIGNEVRRGRPRSAELDEAIRRAAVELLREVDYPTLSLEQIARRAGVGRPTIYRRWSSKAHLVVDALFDVDEVDPLPASGDLRRDLTALIDGLIASFSRPEARTALPGLLADLADGDERSRVLAGLEGRLASELDRRLGLTSDSTSYRGTGARIDSELLVDIIVCAVFNRVIARNRPTAAFAAALTDTVLAAARPVATQGAAR